MFLSLTIISVAAAAILAFVNNQTSPLIAESKRMKLENAIKEVVPGFDNSPLEEAYTVNAEDGSILTIYPASKGGNPIGAAIESSTMKGFSGEIKILVGITPSGEIIDYAILQHAETPGLGDKMDPWFKTDKNKQNILGRDLSKGVLSVTKDGGDVDAITAATISSRAFLDAVNKAYASYSGSIQKQ